MLIHVEVQSQEETGFAQRMFVYHFIDWVMSLPSELDRDFWHSLQQLEEERRMPYITSVERIGIEKGRQEGLLKGIELGLRLKFGSQGLELLPEISELTDVDLLETILEQLATASSLDQLRNTYMPQG